MVIAKRRLPALLLLLAFAAPAAMADLADVSNYSITFTGGGILPTSAGFTYDPDTATFSSFLVTWDGITFDLTGSANAPTTIPSPGGPACVGAVSGAAASFALLSGSCGANPSTDWSGDTEVNHQAGFTFYSADLLPLFTEIEITEFLPSSGPASHDTGGGYYWAIAKVSTAPPPVPEPASIILTLTMLCLVVLVKRNRLRIRS